MINQSNNESSNDDAIIDHRLNANEIASYLQIDAKSLRSFIRKNALMQNHRKNDRYDFSIDDAHMIINAYRNRKSNRSNRNDRSIDEIASLLA